MLGMSGEQEKNVCEISNKIYDKLSAQIKENNIQANILKPLPAPIDKIKNRYRWRIIIKTNLSDKLIEIINNCLYDEEITKSNVRVIADTNPTNML